ncbi:bleomycin resistance family protein [Taibaiella sp. KBW10]|uniref:VOC family protein n=1 Tax=Taibaiella sp. KBW10 TaxID=2153357 RepID=UPI000F5AE1AE|nr:VOC family protein [Taibaiella sp. KBW10]RQO30777.1 bleomycin resistance family protein [Taibaiella sp. KBW10]
MDVKRLSPMLWTDRLEETIAFYVTVLGFTCAEYNDTWGWAALHCGAAELMLARPNEHMPFKTPQFTGSFYFQIDAVDDWYEKIKEQVSIVYTPETFEWGMREFAIRDNNGYMLQFGTSIENT